jgi:hypothetical protein
MVRSVSESTLITVFPPRALRTQLTLRANQVLCAPVLVICSTMQGYSTTLLSLQACSSFHQAVSLEFCGYNLGAEFGVLMQYLVLRVSICTEGTCNTVAFLREFLL